MKLVSLDDELDPVPVGPTIAVVALTLYGVTDPVPVEPTTTEVELALYE